MNLTIKETDIADLDVLMKWREIVLREVFSIPPQENMDELLAANEKYYRTALKDKTHIACFAYADEKPVGCGGVCFYKEMPSPDNPNGICAYLMNIYTVSSMRRKGIGKAIVEKLVQIALQRSAGKIYLESSDTAYPLYKELGFSDLNGYMIYDKSAD